MKTVLKLCHNSYKTYLHSMKRRVVTLKHFKIWLPTLASAVALISHILFKANEKQPIANEDYYLYFSLIICMLTFIIAIYAYINKQMSDKIAYAGLFRAGVIFLISIVDLLTEKFSLLPVVYFPSPSRVIGVLIEDFDLIIKCILYSSRLLFTGFLCGVIIGLISGIAIGFNKHARYWLNPIVRFLGPIPSTAWIPIVLVIFPDTIGASSFLISLAVWFPTTLMTSSGIQNISNSFFEVSETLGANIFYKIFKIGVPAAMPSIFIGIFNGTCSAFITLITAEMIGAKYGIGWYINWQKEMMSYANVYAGLIVIAVTFSILITILFKFKDKILVWQKGAIKW